VQAHFDRGWGRASHRGDLRNAQLARRTEQQHVPIAPWYQSNRLEHEGQLLSMLVGDTSVPVGAGPSNEGLQRREQGPACHRSTRAAPRNGERERLGGIRWAMPPPALDQRREGILRDVLREASAPSPGPRVGQQPRRQSARDCFKVHTGNVPEGSNW
jgi:hypothetical protein